METKDTQAAGLPAFLTGHQTEQDELIAKNARIIETLTAIRPLMQELGNQLEHHDLPTSPFCGLHHSRATGRGV